jgi:hypothetical protein
MNKGITYNVPPSYPVFDMKSSEFANNNKLTTQVQVNQTPTTPTFIIQLSSLYMKPKLKWPKWSKWSKWSK